MNESVTVAEVNPFGIDCQRCDTREDLFEMILTEDSKVLCKDCTNHVRVAQFLKCSNEIFD